MLSAIRSSSSILRNLKTKVPACGAIHARFLNTHEYQSKELMANNGVNTQRFVVVGDANEVKSKVSPLNWREYVIKAQIHAGGRGKGTFSGGLKGGVQLTKNKKDIAPLVSQMLGYKLKTHQTVGDGVLVRKVMIAEALDIARETYFAIIMDRSFGGPVMVASPQGGVDIEEVAAKSPEKIFKEPIDIRTGIKHEQVERLARALEFTGDKVQAAADQMEKLYNLFLAVDATQVEINPFGETPDGQVVCFDAKINFDDNAAFRQKEIFSQHDTAEDDPREVDATKFALNYVGMDGNIGCMVNGAGLAMATMDIIKLRGGDPANFLDVGGGANENQIKEAFRIITSDHKVKAILVNIFGGIMKCDIIARGVIAGARDLGLKIPLIVRLEGTNVELGKKILRESGLAIVPADDLDDAAKKAVKAISF